MRNKLLNKLWLRVGMIVAVMTTAFTGTVKAEEYEAILSLDCATASSSGNKETYGTPTNALSAKLIKEFLNVAAAETAVASVENPLSIYWTKGSGGPAAIPDAVLKIGKASGGGHFTFTIADSYDEINKVSIKGYGWKTSTAVSVNNSATQSPIDAASFVTFDYVLDASTRTITINASSSAFCVTEITLYKEVTDSTPSISVSSTSISVPAEGKNGTIEVTYDNITEVTSEVTFCDAEGNAATYDWITAEINNENNVDYLVEANEGAARTAYFKVWAYDDDLNEVYSELITVTQAAYVAPVASITVSPTTISASAEEIDGTITVTYDNISEVLAEVKFYEADGTTEATYNWIEVDVNTNNNVDYLIEANEGEARIAYLKVWAYDNNLNEVYSELITITQAAYVAPVSEYAILPFTYDGTGNENDLVAGLTQNGIDKSYASSPKIQFNTTGDWLLLKFNERPGRLTFNIKGNVFSDGSFKVQTSTDGITYTDLATYTELTSTVQSEEFKSLGADVRFIKWTYTEKVNGNVALGNIRLAKYGTTVNVSTLTNVAAVEMWDDSMIKIKDGEEVAAGTEVFVRPIAEDGYTIETITVVDENNDPVEVTENSGSWSFIMPNSSVTINATAIETPVVPVEGDKYVKVTSTADLTDGQYLIVYEDGEVALNGGLQTLDATNNTINVTIVNNEIAANETTRAAEFTINISDGTILSASGKYIGQTSYANGLAASTETAYANTLSIDEDENAVISIAIESETVTMRYNDASNQNRFRYYKSGQKAIQLYKFVADTPAPEYESVSVGDLKYSTYASDKALDFTGSSIKAFYPIVDGSTLIFHEITKVPANTGVLLYSANGAVTEDILVCTGETDAVENNVFVRGKGERVSYDETTQEYIYVLSKPQGKNLGFYKAKNNMVATNRAYIRVPAGLSGAKSFTINLEDDPTGIVNLNDNVNANEGAIYNLAGQRLSKMQKGINIINGKKVLK